MKHPIYRWIAVVAILLVCSAWASAGTVYSFHNITNNTLPNVGDQLTVEVDAYGTNQINFRFRNLGPVPSSIAEIYFADGVLFEVPGANSMYSGLNAAFSNIKVSPGSLPGGQDIHWTQQFYAVDSADSKGNVKKGTVDFDGDTLDALEYVDIRLTLLTGIDLSKVIAAIAKYNGNDNPGQPSLRIGLHVRSINGGNSDSYVNNPVPIDSEDPPPPVPVPLPSGFLAGLSLLSGVGISGIIRQRSRHTA